jgi:hypothetical protein
MLTTIDSSTPIKKAASFYVGLGYAPTPVCGGTKQPKSPGWQTKLTVEEIHQSFQQGDNIGLLLGEPSGGLIDIDIDDPDAVILTSLLPPTAMIHGRPSRPGSHRWYKTDGGVKGRKFCDVDGKVLVEMRSNGMQTVVPPSIHPSGEQYTWESFDDPTFLPAAELEESVSLFAAAALLRRHWPELGVRQDAALAVAGFLLNRGIPPDEVPDIVETIARGAGDEEWEKRRQAAIDTVATQASGKPYTGGPTVKKIFGPAVHKKVSGWLGNVAGSWDTDSADMPSVMEELNAKHAVINIGGKGLILNETFDAPSLAPTITFSRPADFRLLYSNQFVATKSNKPKTKADVWLEHPERRQYDGIVFEPAGASPNYYNLWRGFAHEPNPGDCSLFWDHVRDVICAGNPETYAYLRKYLADMVQHPEELPGVAPVLRGGQGTGKNTFVEIVGALARDHYVELTSLGRLIARFNGILKDKLVVFANEVLYSGSKNGDGELKALITDEFRLIELKGKETIPVKNHIRLFLASNEDWAAPIAHDDRRFLVLDVSDKHQNDHAYFAALKQQMKDGGYPALLHDLLQENLTDFDVRRPPVTASAFDIKLQSMNSVHRWLYEMMAAGFFDGVTSFPVDDDSCLVKFNTAEWPAKIRKSLCHEIYLGWCKKNSASNPEELPHFVKQLRKAIAGVKELRLSPGPLGISGVKRVPFLGLPSLEECRLSFEKFARVGSYIWPSAEDD